MSDPRCEDLIDAQLEATLATVRRLVESYPEPSEEDETSLYEYGLSADYVVADTFDDQPEGFFRWQLSWGGPSDEFRFTYGDYAPFVLSVEYRYHDWFDGAGRDLEGDDLELLRDVFYALFADPDAMIEAAEEDV